MQLVHQLGRRRATILVFSLVSLAGTNLSAAQERLETSELAGVALPERSWSWSDDPNGAERNIIETAADLFERSCGQTEYHAWQISDPVDVAGLMQRTDAAFQQAGWSYVRSIPAEPTQAHLLAKDGRGLVLTWVPRPQQDALALFICETETAAVPGQGASRKIGAGEPDAGGASVRTGAAGDPPVLSETAALQPVQTPAASEPGLASVVEEDSFGANGIMMATGALFALVGFGFASNTMRQRRRADAAAKWPRTLGKVISSEILEETSRDSDGHLETHYIPKVWYSYEAGGKPHKSDRIRFGSLYFGTRRQAAKKVTEYPAGSSIQVRYDPADPASATIETVKPSVVTIVFGAIFIVVGAAILVGSLALA